MAIIDHELSAKVAQMLEQFKVVARTRKCLSTSQKRLAVKNLLHEKFEDPLVDGLFEGYKMSLILDEAVRQLQHGITTAAKSPRSPSIKSEDLRDVKEESIESDVEGIEAVQTTVSPAGTCTTRWQPTLNSILTTSTKQNRHHPPPKSRFARDPMPWQVQQHMLKKLVSATSPSPPYCRRGVRGCAPTSRSLTIW
ncbi:hypothetical protein BB8028_0007g03960 [Beauveria bassiana]|uniref:Uncharacterized protein n=1 Tax=Beauveria bassiana TaxID=176275 RepID=A0A2S7YLY3_BEABA|nr:hypothetical protein BB8028_0007g03960 [Beauveria bassiana]